METIRRIFLKVVNISNIFNFFKKYRKGVIVLYYHGVEYEIIDKRIQTIHISFKLFEKQINYLRKNFEIISLDYLYDCLKNGYKIHPSQVLITFDDGYKNNINIVAPFLNTYNIPFSVFISTNHIDKDIRFPAYYLFTSIFYTEHKFIEIKTVNKKFDISTQNKRSSACAEILKILKTVPQNEANLIVEELINLIPEHKWLEINDKFSSDEPMNWEDIKQLHNSGVTIGSHCHNHAILHLNQSSEEINYQLARSKDLIEKHLGVCKYFAYPNGGINNIANSFVASVKEHNYLLGFTTVLGELEANSNPYILPRIGGEKDLDLFKFDLETRLRYKGIYYNWQLKLENL